MAEPDKIDQSEKVVDTRENKSESALIEEVRSRMRDSGLSEHDERTAGLDDLKFKKGGLNQWPDEIIAHRQKKDVNLPMLTINKLPTFCDQVIGDARQNKITIKIRATTNDEENKDAAKIREGLIRSIQEQSNADIAYQTAEQGAVDSGRGVFSVSIVDNDQNPFVRDLLIDKVSNSYSHYFDPKYHASGKERDRRYHIVTEMVSRGEYKIRYPGKTPMKMESSVGDNEIWWAKEDEVRIADYWVKRPDKKTIYLLDDGRIVDGEKWQKIQDELEPVEIAPQVVDEKETDSFKLLLYKVDGQQILDGPFKWDGRYIPHIPVWGKEINIEGKRDLRGVIRNAKDPQKIYNFQRTAETINVALQQIPPTDVTPKMIKGHEAQWKSDAPMKYRLFNPDPAIPGGPNQNSPPQASSGNLQLTQIADQELKDTTGIQKSGIGQESSAGSSGKKEALLQKEGDVGNYEYHDNLARSIKQCGRVLLDLLPTIYDTERTVLILGEDNAEKYEVLNEQQSDGKIGNDMSVGQYRVVVTVGPSYTTQRQETLENLSNLSKNVPLIRELAPDMIVKNMDFVGADEVIDRIRWYMIMQGIIEPDEEEKEKYQEKQAQQQDQGQQDPEMLVKMMELQLKGMEAQLKSREVDRKEFETMIDSVKTIVETGLATRSQEMAEITDYLDRLEASMKETPTKTGGKENVQR